MWFLSYIIEQLASARDWLLDAYYEVDGWIFPFYYLKYPLYGLYVVFYYLVYYFGDFNNWLVWAADRIDEILSEWDIWSLLSAPISWAETAYNWVNNATSNIWQTVNSWWTATSPTILGWIDAAKGYSLSLYNSLLSNLNTLQSEWDNFKADFPSLDNILLWFSNWWGNIRANLDLWWSDKLLEIQGLITSRLVEFAPFWEGWQDWRDQVAEFFSDPLQWVYDKLDEWFERFW